MAPGVSTHVVKWGVGGGCLGVSLHTEREAEGYTDSFPALRSIPPVDLSTGVLLLLSPSVRGLCSDTVRAVGRRVLRAGRAVCHLATSTRVS